MLPPAFDPGLYRETHRIASTRLRGYDYGQSGIYFITICTQDRQPAFGTMEVPGNDWDAAFVRPTPLGQRVLAGWDSIPVFAPFATPEAFVLMPDHVHGLLVFEKHEPAGLPLAYQNQFGPQRANLASVVRGFKSGITTYARHQALPFQWQARYHDRIVRSADELIRIRHYIATNPSRWQHEWDNGEGLYR
ncbi:transposase [Hymenobacter psoromatis]|uniref:transposase n=1 Tax=Hymenobacter psoromatis TaxID=1484116 RepID=UPI001CBE747E|nr:transposase [Hymenobacter psoromatis]